MECPNCKNPQVTNHRCHNCGIDTLVYLKSTRISNLLYNRGLEKATKSQYTAATVVLKQSIQFNKNNFVARNLLGLIYYEIGEIGDALSQWIISANLAKENNHATGYLQKIQANADELYVKNDAVQLYNRGLACMHNRDTSGAIEALTQAKNLNPKFITAMNLLTFVHLIEGNKDEALTIISQVLKIDKHNHKASGYYSALTGKPPRPPAETIRVGTKPMHMTVPPPVQTVEQESKKYSLINLAHIASFAIGALVTFAALFFFVLPGIVSNQERENTALQNERNRLTEQLQAEREAHDLAMDELMLENQTMTAQLEIIDLEHRTMVQASHIENVRRLVASAELIEAAEILYNLDTSLVFGDDIADVQQLMEVAFAGASLDLYHIGLNHYNQGNFEIAIGFFERSLRFAEFSDESGFFVDDATYFLGRIAQHQGNYHWAQTLFRQVIEHHPSSNLLNQATQRLAQVEEAIIFANVTETDESEEEGSDQ